MLVVPDRHLNSGISILAVPVAPLYTKRPSAWAGCVRGSCFQLRHRQRRSRGGRTCRKRPDARAFLGHLSRVAPSLRQPCSGAPAAHQPVGNGRAQIRCSITPEHASGQMTLRQQQPVVPRVFHQAPARLDEALLEAGQRPAVDVFRQYEPPPQIPEVVGEHAQLQPDLVRPEPVTRQPRPMRRLLAIWLTPSAASARVPRHPSPMIPI